MSSGGRRRRRLSVTVSHLYFHIKFSFYNEPWKKIELISFLFFLHSVLNWKDSTGPHTWQGNNWSMSNGIELSVSRIRLELASLIGREFLSMKEIELGSLCPGGPPLSHLHRDRLIVRGKNAPSNTSFDVDLVTWQALFLSIASLYATACRACSTLNEMKDLQLRRESVCRAGGGGFKVKNS